ncbi:V-set and immunoglobulin domain-containing protein 10-like [Oncorhynchus keta]|uniref:V-set and immunoglobulin domain-containing protein 10-like n=1 Tax=Oncorhynchus keta TaxID=8018 RepID=UPI00227C7A2E|nr:V-set and immunoglobulin domain-containing protein 10-like [Oncorhynchus keta]
MNGFAVAIFLQVMHQTVAANGRSDETTVAGTLGENIILPCWNTATNVTPSFTRWMTNGQFTIERNHSIIIPISPSEGHLTILYNQSLYINRINLSDEGIYLCDSLPHNNKTQTSLTLQIVSGPDNSIIDIQPATPLSNGTLFVVRGSTVSFNCSSLSYPSQSLSWGFQGVESSNDSLAVGRGSWLDFRIEDVQPTAQGNYSCRAQNSISQKAAGSSTELLVYYSPERHPECLWNTGKDLSHVQFSCSWFGGYPSPTLFWGEKHQKSGSHAKQVAGQLMESEETDNLVVNLNRSLLFDGQMLKCSGHHPTISPGEDKFCSFTLKSPYPEGEPLVTAVEGTNVTLTCTESNSLPPALTRWQRTVQQEDVVSSPKYVLSEQGPTFTLTIVNITKQDEGFYFCRSENPLMVRELEIYLTVKATSQYTGAIIGIFLAILIVGSGIVIAKTIYSNRDRICLGNGFEQMGERGDVLSLVEADEEEVFHEAIPRLPPLPLTNGHNTTLVEIHTIPSIDHEDAENLEHPLQLEDGDIDELVTF